MHKWERENKQIRGYIGSNIYLTNTKGPMPELSGLSAHAISRFGFLKISLLNIAEGKNIEPSKLNEMVLKHELNLVSSHELKVAEESSLLFNKVTNRPETGREVSYDRAQKWTPKITSVVDAVPRPIGRIFSHPSRPDLLLLKTVDRTRNVHEIFHEKMQPLVLKRSIEIMRALNPNGPNGNTRRRFLDIDRLRLVSSHKPISLKIMPFPRTEIISWKIGSQILDRKSIASSVIFHRLSAEEDSSATLTALTAGANIRDRAREPPAVEMEHKAAGPTSIEMEKRTAWPLPVNIQYADIQSTPSHIDHKASDQQTEERMINSTDAIQGQRYNQNTSHINIAKLSDQVQHIIERKIKIEKERRGIYV